MHQVLQMNHHSKQGLLSSFDRIAAELLFNRALLINDTTINFTEIEFYYFCDVHKDGYTHCHNVEIGKLRAHQYGVDISLGADDNKFGGILIRGIEVNGVFINKPRLVINALINTFPKLNSSLCEMKLVSKESGTIKYFKTFRNGLGQPDPEKYKTVQFKNAQYRYILFDQRVFKNLQNKNMILENSTLSIDQIQQLRNKKF